MSIDEIKLVGGPLDGKVLTPGTVVEHIECERKTNKMTLTILCTNAVLGTISSRYRGAMGEPFVYVPNLLPELEP